MKKQKKSGIVGWMAFLVCVFAISSCTYHVPDEDWEKNGKVRLHLDWQTRSSYPSGMTYYFYKDGTGHPVVRLGSVTGYEGTLPSGHYKVVVCNTDCDNVQLEMNNGYEQALGKARLISSLKSASVHIARPGNLYGTGCQSIDVGGEKTVVEELYPVSLVKTLELNIKVTGGEDIRLTGLSGRLTGVSSQIQIPTGKALFDTPAFMAFEPESANPGVYTSSLNLFGLSDGGEEGDPVELYLTLTLKDGKEVTSFTDITGEVGKAFEQSISAHVVLDLEIAYDEINGATITLSGWKEGTGEAGN
ncbi:hypothetical protein HMPREF1212_01977 [Parabacteroides sp. HGS0025]|uniref:DUF5119 domain-containing protein n=1 Tax=Parabacteroides sp. HGS0025 TaxID=1078087 RepID=UPI00061730CD|nr:DUF5119 domain-containing protein [Parabacteroides sp. HGS0025]KKB51247.1 hypothetical protein HMPREF1212_01977 [Parabacteroides sp. HGS0025]